jgi:hypothetical protein
MKWRGIISDKRREKGKGPACETGLMKDRFDAR